MAQDPSLNSRHLLDPNRDLVQTEAKILHRPSRTPTGLPGDEPKSPKKKRRQKLAAVVDQLVAPELKAARRIVRGHNKDMAAKNSMTLYDRIMAYRKLKVNDPEGGSEESSSPNGNTKERSGTRNSNVGDRRASKGNATYNDRRQQKLERSDTGFTNTSVDISQYTNRKDDDDYNKSPSPQPTLENNAYHSSKKHNYEEKLTSRDVQVEVEVEATEDTRNSRNEKRSIEKTTESSHVRQEAQRGDYSSNDDKRSDESSQYRQEVSRNERSSNAVQVEEAAVVASAAAASQSRSENRDTERNSTSKETYKQVESNRESGESRDVRKEESRNEIKEERKEEYRHQRKSDSRAERAERRNESRTDRVEKRSESRTDRVEKRSESHNDRVEKRNESRSERVEKVESRNEERSREEVSRSEKNEERFSEKAAVAATAVSATTVTAAAAAATSSRNSDAAPKGRSEPPRPASAKRNKKKAAIDDSMMNDIARLDMMVDNDLNSVLGKGDNPEAAGNAKDKELKAKILSPEFQSKMDDFLRNV